MLIDSSVMNPDFSAYEQMGKDWLDGKIIIRQFGEYKLNPKQIAFINSKERSCLGSGGMASGKTLAFIIKFILLMQMFPGSHALIGRKTKENAQETFMKDFMDVCPEGLYTHQKGYGKIVFTNGSEAEFWGLDALQSGATTDIKKAEQKLKSHNFTFIFTDQLEEEEQKVFDALHSRMRKRMCTHSADQQTVHRNAAGDIIYEVCGVCGKYTFNQYNATTNPANYWAYDWFKQNPRPNTFLVESGTLDNKEHLPQAFIEGELAKPELYRRRYFYGEWSPDSMVEGGVFYDEWIKAQANFIKSPIRVLNGIRIFEEPQKEEYQIGIDPSDGSVDPCNITCVSKRSGRVVATYSANVPTNVIVEKAVQIGMMYSALSMPLIVPESVGAGLALVEALRPVYDNIYIREQTGTKYGDKKTTKLGFYTNFKTKTLLIENMKKLFSVGFPKILDGDAVEELKTFIYTNSALAQGAGAQNGYHDDRIMGMMLAYWDVPPQYVAENEGPTEEFKLYDVRYS